MRPPSGCGSPRELHFPEAVGRRPGDILPLGQRGHAAPLEPAVYGFVFPAGHEEAELEILLIRLVGGVIDLLRSDDLRAAVLEGLRHHALVPGVASGEAGDLHDQHALESAGLHCGQELLHLRPVGDRIAADDLLVDVGDGVPPLLRQGQEGVPVALEGVEAAGLELQVPVLPGLAEVHEVLFHGGASCEKPPRSRLAGAVFIYKVLFP